MIDSTPGVFENAQVDIYPLVPVKMAVGIISIFFRILKTLYRPCFFIVLMLTGVKTKVLDKIWQKNHFLTVYHG